MKIIDIKIKIAAIKVLVKEIGWPKLLRIAPNLTKRTKRGEPYASLPPAVSPKDIDSRALIAEAILLYRELLIIYPQERAESIIRKVIIEAAIAQLRCLIPTLKRDNLMKMSDQDRTKSFCDIVSKFPNTDWELKIANSDKVKICMSRCRLVEIFDAVGHPELRNSCCAGDGLYFERHQTDIEFIREEMIGIGDNYCDFNFKLK